MVTLIYVFFTPRQHVGMSKSSVNCSSAQTEYPLQSDSMKVRVTWKEFCAMVAQKS